MNQTTPETRRKPGKKKKSLRMSLFTKVASTLLGTKIASDTSKGGLPGVALGVIATRMMTRSPFGTLLVGSAWLGHKIWKKKREIDAEGPKVAAKKRSPAKPKALPAVRHTNARANGQKRRSSPRKAPALQPVIP